MTKSKSGGYNYIGQNMVRRVSQEKRNLVIRRLLPVVEAAQFLGIEPKTLRNRLGPRAANPFPVKPKKIGRKVLFDLRDLETFVDELPYVDQVGSDTNF